MRVRKYSSDVFSYIWNELVRQDRQLKHLENRRVPTFPRLDPAALPSTAIETQLVVGHDDAVYAYKNGAWLDANTTS